MKRYIIVSFILFLTLLHIGCVKQAYPSREECVTAEMAGKRFLLEVQGVDSSLLCYYSSDSTYTYKTVVLQNGLWKVSQQWKFQHVYLDGYASCVSVQPQGSIDRYLLISPGTAGDSQAASLMWSPSDCLGSVFFKNVYVDGRSATFLVRIPSSVEQYDLQLNEEWCIKGIDFRCEWTETPARRLQINE